MVAIGGTEGDVLEVAAVVEQGLEGRETHQRQAGHLVMDTGVLQIKKKNGTAAMMRKNE